MKLQMPLLIVVMIITLVYAMASHTDREKKLCVGTTTVILSLFSGLRSWWMGDLIKYYTLYTRCIGSEWSSALEEKSSNLGIRWFFHLAGKLGLSYETCILLIAVFVAVTLGILVYRYSPSPYWSYMMYIAMGFFIFTYSGLKQSIAMGFVILAALALFEQKPVWFVVWCLVGGWFHAPSLIFLAAYPFSKLKINRTYFLVLAVFFVLIFLFRDQIVQWMADLYYDDEDKFTPSSKIVGGRFLMMVLILVIGVVLRPLRDWDKTYVQVFGLMVLAAALQSMSVYDNNFTRLADYYYQFIVLFLPMMMETGESRIQKLPDGVGGIRYFTRSTYMMLGIGITLFALWYYNDYVSSASAILQDFRFRWEINPYSLYGQ